MFFKNIILASFLLLSCSSSFAGDIAYGTIKAIKVYNTTSQKVTKIYFNDDSTHLDEASCNAIAIVQHTAENDEDKMLSVALSAYMAGKKARAYSETAGSCYINLLTVSDTYI